MMLDSDKIASLGIISDPVAKGRRATTYDATVGDIILDGLPIKEADYRLPKRGLVWVVSHEEFRLPPNVTGLATLRTTWTHNGVLALNVGIIDPNWNGPLATAVVNFSDKDFPITKGEPFFRVIFHEHAATSAPNVTKSREAYLREISDKSARTPNTFLNLSSLADEVRESVFTFPRWANRISAAGVVIAVIATLVALIAIFVPTAYGITTEWRSQQEELRCLTAKVEKIDAELNADDQKTSPLGARIMAPKFQSGKPASCQNP